MSAISELFSHPDDYPLGFFDPDEDSKISDDTRSAFVHAAVEEFVLSLAKEKKIIVDTDVEINDQHKLVAATVVFLGPYLELEESMKACKHHSGILVAPTLLWKKKKVFVYVAVLGN